MHDVHPWSIILTLHAFDKIVRRILPIIRTLYVVSTLNEHFRKYSGETDDIFR